MRFRWAIDDVGPSPDTSQAEIVAPSARQCGVLGICARGFGSALLVVAAIVTAVLTWAADGVEADDAAGVGHHQIVPQA